MKEGLIGWLHDRSIKLQRVHAPTRIFQALNPHVVRKPLFVYSHPSTSRTTGYKIYRTKRTEDVILQISITYVRYI